MLRTEFNRLLQPQQALNSNPLAKGLYRILDREGFIVTGNPKKESDVIDWMTKIVSLELDRDEVPWATTSNGIVDEFLFKSISIKGIKKIPRTDAYMRLNFCNAKNYPVSTVIMGENGVGKTSFYGAMEFTGMGEMNTARIYGQRKDEYIKNIFSLKSDVSAVLKTTHGDLKLDTENPKANCVPAFYISEWDIRELEGMPDFGPFIFSQLGVQDYNLFLTFLISVRDRLADRIATQKALLDTIKSKSIEVEALKLIIANKATKSTKEIKSIVDEYADEIPELLIGNRLVDDGERLISDFEERIKTDPAYSYYGNAYKGIAASSVSEAIEELKKAVHQHREAPYWDSKRQIKRAIGECKKKRTEFISFKQALKESISELLDTHTEPLTELIQHAFIQKAELSMLIREWEGNFDYSLMRNAEDLDKVKEYLDETIDVLEARFNELVRKWKNEIIEPILSSLLEEYFKDEKESIEIVYKEQNRSLSAVLMIPKVNDSGARIVARTNPRAYFNTFRFKMFVVSLKVALACCAKYIYNANWPIVVDDVFNSTDFCNRSRMGDYIKRICRTYDQLEKVKNMQFQLIFFTQDDVIGDAVFDGLRTKNKSAKLLRLHDYRCFQKSDEQQLEKDLLHIDVGMEVKYCGFN